MYLCSYVEAAFGETSQDVDPEDSDFQVPYLFFSWDHFWLPWADFLVEFSPIFSNFCSILGPIFGSVFGTKNRASESGFNRILNKILHCRFKVSYRQKST